MNRTKALMVLESIPWNKVRYRIPIGEVALSEEEMEAVAVMLTVLRTEPDPDVNSVDSPLARYNNG